jgi:hypothetical protein
MVSKPRELAAIVNDVAGRDGSPRRLPAPKSAPTPSARERLNTTESGMQR